MLLSNKIYKPFFVYEFSICFFYSFISFISLLSFQIIIQFQFLNPGVKNIFFKYIIIHDSWNRFQTHFICNLIKKKHKYSSLNRYSIITHNIVGMHILLFFAFRTIYDWFWREIGLKLPKNWDANDHISLKMGVHSFGWNAIVI